MTLRVRIAGCAVVMALSSLVSASSAHGEVRVDVKRELQLIEQGKVTRHIPNARNRVAVFSFEDPDHTGLGVLLAALAGRTILTSSRVNSLGVLRYEGDLAPERPGAPGYFDKVERILAAQGVSLAVWGRVRRSRGQLLVDTYLQIPPEEVTDHFSWTLQLPAKMKGGALRARLNPNRLALQRLTLDATIERQLRAASAALDELRAEPNAAAAVQVRLPQGQTYSLEEAREGWVRLRLDGTRSGWAQVPTCSNPCGRFLSAANFAGQMLRFMSDRTVPVASDDLTPEARAAADQVRALSLMKEVAGLGPAGELAERWLRRQTPGTTELQSASVASLSGGTFANILVLSNLAGILVSEYDFEIARRSSASPVRPHGFDREAWSSLAPSPNVVDMIARRLAESAILHPRDPDLLHNLAILFDYTGDSARAAIANKLAEQASH